MNVYVVICPACLGDGYTDEYKNTCVRCMGLRKVPAHDGVAEWVGWCPALHDFMSKP